MNTNSFYSLFLEDIQEKGNVAMGVAKNRRQSKHMVNDGSSSQRSKVSNWGLPKISSESADDCQMYGYGPKLMVYKIRTVALMKLTLIKVLGDHYSRFIEKTDKY